MSEEERPDEITFVHVAIDPKEVAALMLAQEAARTPRWKRWLWRIAR